MSQRITWEQTKPMIVIDFEGEGKKEDGTTPDPILLGAWGPYGREGKMTYRAWLLDPLLAPVTKTRTIAGQRIVATLEEALEEILDLAESRGLLIGSFSVHERDMIREKAPQLADRFEAVWTNILEMARRECRRLNRYQDQYSLENVIQALNVNVSPPVPPRRGAAEACRTVMRGAAHSRRWRRWTETQKEMARELIRYNREDVKVAWKVLRHCCWRENSRRPVGQRSS